MTADDARGAWGRRIGLSLMLTALIVDLAPAPPAAPAGAVSEIADEVAALAATPRFVGTASASAARAAFIERARPLSLRVESDVVCTEMACGRVHNVVGRIGADASGPPVILVAHLDTVAASPGAHDDALGVAVWRQLLLGGRAEPARPTWILFDDGEEVGLLGARAFVARHGPFPPGTVALNIDGMAGPTVAETAGPPGLGRLLAADPTLRTLSASRVWMGRSVGFDDRQVFAAAGIPTVVLEGRRGYALYHTPRDTPASLDAATIGARATSAARVAQAALRQQPTRRAEGYVTVAGWGVLVAPPILWRGVAVIAALLALAGLRGSARSLRAALLLAAVAAAAGALWAATPGRVGAGHTVGLLVGGLLGVALAARLRPDPVAVAAQVAVGLALLAAALALFVPEVAPPFVVAGAGGAAVAGLTWLPVAAVRRGRAGRPNTIASVERDASWGAALPAWLGWSAAAGLSILAFDVWIDLAPDGAGLRARALAAVPFVVLALVAAPAAAAFSGRARRLAGVALTAGVLGPALVPAPDPGASGSLRLVDVGAGARHLVLYRSTDDAWPAPEGFVEAPGAYPWSSGDRPVLRWAVDFGGGPPPEVRTATASRGLRWTVRSRRGAASYKVGLAPDAPVGEVRIEGELVPFGPDATRWTHGWRTLSVHGLPDGFTLEVERTGPGPIRLRVGDVQQGLPKEAAPVLETRPEGTAPIHQGDSTEVFVEIEAGGPP